MKIKQRLTPIFPSERILNPLKRIHTAGMIRRRQDSQDLNKNRDPALSRTALSPRTRHYEHRTRLARENTRGGSESLPYTAALVDASPSEVGIHAEESQDPRTRPRHRDSARMHSLLARSSESGIHAPGSRFLTEADQKQDESPKNSALDKIIPSPDKRFEMEEFPDNGEDGTDKEGFVGRMPMGGNGYPSSFLGFGSFNYSSDRYPTDASKSNESTLNGRWGGHQVSWPIRFIQR